MKQLQRYMAVFCGPAEYLWAFLFSFFTGRKVIIILECVIYNFIKLFCGRTYFILLKLRPITVLPRSWMEKNDYPPT